MVIFTGTYLLFLVFCGVSYVNVTKADYSFPMSEVARHASLCFIKDNACVATLFYALGMIVAGSFGI